MSRPAPPNKPSSDARGDTGTAADRVPQSRPAAGAGGVPSPVDAGVAERLGRPHDPALEPVERDAVRAPADHEPAARPVAGDAPRRDTETKASEAKANDEGPLESLGKAVSAPITGANTGRKRRP